MLVVDDNESSRSIVVEIVRGWSMRPTVCANGEAALDILRGAGADHFRLTIVDAAMPGMDGYEFLETARRDRLVDNSVEHPHVSKRLIGVDHLHLPFYRGDKAPRLG